VYNLLEKKYKIGLLSSDLNPKKRTSYFQAFDLGKLPILVATDLASRGIDTKVLVNHVILYDFPKTVIDYLHRVGRTARAGNVGVVTAFVNKEDEALACKIRDAYKEGISLSNIAPIDQKSKNVKKKKMIIVDQKYLDEDGKLKNPDSVTEIN